MKFDQHVRKNVNITIKNKDQKDKWEIAEL